jgi:hypothetical protein
MEGQQRIIFLDSSTRVIRGKLEAKVDLFRTNRAPEDIDTVGYYLKQEKK